MKFDIEVPEWANWIAQDENGEWFAHTEKPRTGYSIWLSNRNKTMIALSKPNDNWKEELYEVYWE